MDAAAPKLFNSHCAGESLQARLATPAKLRVAELRDALGAAGLAQAGKKAELVARLEAHLAHPNPYPNLTRTLTPNLTRTRTRTLTLTLKIETLTLTPTLTLTLTSRGAPRSSSAGRSNLSRELTAIWRDRPDRRQRHLPHRPGAPSKGQGEGCGEGGGCGGGGGEGGGGGGRYADEEVLYP